MRHPSVPLCLVLAGLSLPAPLPGWSDPALEARIVREAGRAPPPANEGRDEVREESTKAGGEIVGQSHLVAAGIVGQPVITADGRVVVFTVVAADGTADLWRWEEGHMTRITTDGDGKFRPRLSADGSVIVWCQQMDSRGRKDWDPMMWRDGVVTDLVEDPVQSLYIDVSGDGDRIVWDQDGKGRGRDLDIWIHEKGETRALTQLAGDQGYPVISGDGLTVVFRDYSQTPAPHIGWMMRWRQGQIEPVLPGETRSQLQPAITADGATVYYTLVEGEWLETIHRVTEGQDPQRMVDLPGLCQGVSVSDDGAVFAFSNVSREGASWDVYFSTGGALHPVVQGRGNQLNCDIDGTGHNLMWMDSYAAGEAEHEIYRFRWSSP